MAFQAPLIARLRDGRLHLQHGPIDVVLRAWGNPEAVRAAEAAAATRFATILTELVEELPQLRLPVMPGVVVDGPVARLMVAACQPFAATGVFVTAMAAVAGAVADELLASMRAAAPLARAFVNDGGDIALYSAPGEALAIGMVADPAGGGVFDGTMRVEGSAGVASSGRHGRSFSLGIADTVTTLADSAAAADVAATLVANAVTLDSPAIARCPAHDLDPDSDLGALPVTLAVGPLAAEEVETALRAGAERAEAWRRAGLLRAAALRLNGEARFLGNPTMLEACR